VVNDNRLENKIKYIKTKKSKKILIKFLDFLCLLILTSLFLGLILYPIFLNLDDTKSKNNEIALYTQKIYSEAKESRLLSFDENNNMISRDDIIYDEIRRSVKTRIDEEKISIRGDKKDEYEVFDSLKEERINYYCFIYRKNFNLKDDFILNSYSFYLIDYYDLKEDYFSLKIDVAKELKSYIFEDEYTNKLKEVYDKFYEKYSSFYNYLIEDFEKNNNEYKLNLTILESKINEYSMSLIIVSLISYIFSYLIYFIVPRIIFKTDKTLVMKIFKVKIVDLKKEEDVGTTNFIINLVISLILNVFLIGFINLLFFNGYSCFSVSLLGINIIYYLIFFFVLSLLNNLVILFNKNNLSLFDILLNRVWVEENKFIKDE